VLFFMPDFARTEYATRPWYAELAPRFRAISGAARCAMMPARTRLLHTLALLAGKWPHTGSLQPGGSAQPVGTAERLQLYALVRDFRAYCEAELFGDRLEVVAQIETQEALRAWLDKRERGDFGRFLRIADDLNLWSVGRAGDRFLSYGAYRIEGACLFPAGVWDGGPQEFDPSDITEDVSHAWLGGAVVAPPAQGATLPVQDKEGGYSWCKAPRLGGRVMEVGALARQMIAGHPLIRGIVARHGGSVAARVIARLLEIAQIVPALERWALAIKPAEPFCEVVELPDEGCAFGAVEAARGSLGHWLTVQRGAIANYQIVAPTTWNFSPRDRHGQPGALETALIGLEMPERGTVPARVQHVVRSFDPCMVCTVH
jgi:hydrogenase large subunit